MIEDADPPTSQTDSAKKPVQRLGFLAGQFAVPDDFNQMACGEIDLLFTDESEWTIDLVTGSLLR